jgi:hypothetical protein
MNLVMDRDAVSGHARAKGGTMANVRWGLIDATGIGRERMIAAIRDRRLTEA